MTRRYTDTTLTLLVKNRNITTASHVYVTLSQYIPDDVNGSSTDLTFYSGGFFRKKKLTIESSSVSYSNPNTIVVINLTQEQNAMFQEGYIRIQINWIDSSNNRKATVIKRIRHHANLHEEVL